jgi:hypothetical protein
MRAAANLFATARAGFVSRSTIVIAGGLSDCLCKQGLT